MKKDKISQQPPVKLIVGLLYNSDEIRNSAEHKLVDDYGIIDFRSEIIKFDFTDYYSDEIGVNLLRYWISFNKLISSENIHKLKIRTNEIEAQYCDQFNRRKINIDPGYITGSKLILLSTKDYSHRIYLSDGIYAEVTLIYRNNRFNDLEWTYPDYRTETAKMFFSTVRTNYLQQLKCNNQGINPR